MFWTLLALSFRLLTGVGLDYLWTGWILKDVVPPLLKPRWSLQWDSTCLSLHRFTMGLLRSLDLVCSLVLATLSTSSSAGNVSLPSYPLAVKSPYLSAWVPGNQAHTNAATAQPEFWTGSALTWPILARVNNATYSLFGNPNTNGTSNASIATTDSVSYTSSHTYIHVTAGQANFILDFFSPVLPGKDDYARQSLPYSYLTISVTSSSYTPPQVQVLTAIDYTWTAQNGASQLNYTTSGSAGFFWFYNPNEIPFTEVKDMATYGSVLFGTTTESGMSAACGTLANVYGTFTSRGSVDSQSIGQHCLPTDLVALSKDLGISGHIASSATFVVGFDRVQAINYLNKSQTGFHRTQWPEIPQAIEYVLNDYESVYASSLAFDANVRSRAEAVSSDFGSQYADIVEASVRQTFGGMELTVCAHLSWGVENVLCKANVEYRFLRTIFRIIHRTRFSKRSLAMATSTPLTSSSNHGRSSSV